MTESVMTTGFRILEKPETFPLLPALAERLGVKANGEGRGRVALVMKNGDSYDLFELINAFLDRLDG